MLSTRFLSHAFQLKTKFILVVRDQSGSMYDYKKNLDLACINLETNYGSSSSEFGLHFVAFAGPGYLGDSPRIMDLQHISGNTSIAQAFRRAIEILSLLAKHGRFDEVVIVFISDGEDNHKEQCEAELQQLQGEMPCKSKLFCVGCRGFPTGFVAGTPFKIFGRGNDECEAPVIACPSPEDVPFVFAELEKLIESKGKAQILPVEELASTADPALLVRAAQCSYNRAVNRSMYFKQDSELEAFRDCKSYLGSVMSKLVERVRAVKRTDAHVLLSDDLKAVPRPAQLTALAANVEIVRRLHNQASACLDMAERGEMISKLDDESKLEIAGLAGRLGALTGVVMKYHRPEAERIKKSLFKFLEEYPEHASLPPAKFDDQIKVDDNLTLCDLFRDAKSVLPVVSRYWTIQDIVERFPFVGYPVECTYISKGAAMNPWLVQVVAFDPARIIPMQALSLEFPWNCMIIIPSFNPGSDTSYVKYAASCLLYGGGLFQNEAYWSLLAAGVTHLLECNVTYSLEWRGMISALYAQLRRCFQSVYPWAHSCAYLEKLKAPSEFRKCLVSEHPLLSADHADLRLTCPHLTKFVFGLWYILTDPNAEKGTLLTGGQLRSMYIAFMVEFFYRAGQRLVWTPVDCKVDTEQLLEPLVYRRMANLSAQAPTLSRVCDMFWPCVREYVETLRKSPELLVDAPALSEEALNRASHYQFNWDAIKGIFAGLFYCGKDDLEGEFTTALTQRELARILLLAQKHGNLERNTSAEYDQPLPEDQFKQLGYHHALAPILSGLYSAARDDLASRYFADLDRCHQAPPVRLDGGVVQLWSLENGRDAVGGLNINSDTGLPFNACSCPTCPHFLVPLDLKPAPGKMSSALKAHHHGIKKIPGLHAAVFRNFPRTNVESKEDYVQRIVAVVRKGSQMEWVHPNAAKIAAKINSYATQSRMPGDYGKEAREQVAKLKAKLQGYACSVMKKVSEDFPANADLERAVLVAMDSAVYTKDETFAALDKVRDKFARL